MSVGVAVYNVCLLIYLFFYFKIDVGTYFGQICTYLIRCPSSYFSECFIDLITFS